MSKQTDKSLFMFSPSSKYAGFYQRLLSGIANYGQLGNRIIIEIKAAHAFRQVEEVKELSRILINIPIKEYRLIGEYYLVWCQCRELKYRTQVLERIIEQTQTYKTRALFSRAAFVGYQGKTEEAFYFYGEAFKTSPTISEHVDLTRSIAVLKAQEGFHKSALRDLENLVPVIRHAEPIVYYDFLNSYSLELGEAGRKFEARNIIKHVLASPFAFAYPEWQDTARDLKEADRSFVTVPSIQRRHVEIQTTEARQPTKTRQPASVLSFPKLKEAPLPQKPERLTPQQYIGLSIEDRREMIFAALKSGSVREDDYYKMMVMLGLLKSGPADEILDLEDDEVLDDIACVWSAQIGAEELAGFLSALRDCDDSLRRSDILDRLIRKIFHETQICEITEEEWRLRVERRLPKK